MFPYTEKYTESDIQNINSLYIIDQQMPKYFRFVGTFPKHIYQISNCLFCYLYKLHNAYFVNFVNVVIFVWIFCICKWPILVYIYSFSLLNILPNTFYEHRYKHLLEDPQRLGILARGILRSVAARCGVRASNAACLDACGVRCS